MNKWIGTEAHVRQLRSIHLKGNQAGLLAIRRKAEDRRLEYYTAPRRCEKCEEEISYERRKQRFCSCSCANSILKRKPQKPKRTLIEFHIERLTTLPYEKLGEHLKRRRLLLEQNDRCAECQIEQVWNGKPLVFQLDHKDGDRTNNTRKNHRLLCPNCHTQTETWGRKRRVTIEVLDILPTSALDSA